MKCGWTLDRLEARMGYLPKFSTAPATQLMVGSLEPSLDAIELDYGNQLRNNFSETHSVPSTSSSKIMLEVYICNFGLRHELFHNRNSGANHPERNNKLPTTRPGESADFWLISPVDRKSSFHNSPSGPQTRHWQLSTLWPWSPLYPIPAPICALPGTTFAFQHSVSILVAHPGLTSNAPNSDRTDRTDSHSSDSQAVSLTVEHYWHLFDTKPQEICGTTSLRLAFDKAVPLACRRRIPNAESRSSSVPENCASLSQTIVVAEVEIQADHSVEQGRPLGANTQYSDHRQAHLRPRGFKLLRCLRQHLRGRPCDVCVPCALRLNLTDTKPEGLRQAPKVNQPFIPDTAPARRSHHQSFTSPQPSMSPQVNMNPAANPQSAHFAVESWEGKGQTQLPMSTREVPTPGNRPALFANLDDRNKVAKQPDFYDPYFPLRFLEVPRSKLHLPTQM